MRRLLTLTLLTGLLAAGIVLPQASRVSATGQTNIAPAKKVCKTTMVHGKRKKVCTTARSKPKPTATPTLTLAQRVDAAFTSDHFSGSILLEKGGQILLEKAYGMADRASNTPNTLQTRFPLFGIDFFMAAVGIMKLAEEGKLSVQDKLCSYIVNCPASWQPITLDELLTSTAGISDYNWALSTGGLDTTLTGCEAPALVEAPGGRITESDCNAFLLDTIIEKVSGRSWSDYMQQTIFGPAGMTDTGRMVNSLLPPQRARGYTFNGPAPDLNYDAYYMPYSTLEDVYRFDTALLGGKILSRQSLDELLTPRKPRDPGFLARDTDLTGRQFYVGYGFRYAIKASGTEVTQILPAGGTVAWGFYIDNFFSPDTGAVGIELNNDTSAFTDVEEHGFWDLDVRPVLFGE